MTFVSYAKNFEDVMLWRALRHLSPGFYVDVGAMHPDEPSVTRAFYERGWNGLNVTPLAPAMQRLQAQRLRDITLQTAVGAYSGSTTMHLAHDLALSTTDPDALDALRAAGIATGPVSVPVETLDVLLDRHAPGEIHFLRIDAAGAELGVLQGVDLHRHRPWVIVVRAVVPLSGQENERFWEPDLRACGYAFVWFDGISRFYVAEEHEDDLAPAFRTPPNVSDDFIRVADTDVAIRVARAETRATVQADRAAAAEQRAREDTAALMEIRVLNEHRLQQIRALDAALVAAQVRVEAEAARTREASAWLDAVRASTSWRATAPVRALLRRVARQPETTDPAAPDIATPLPPLVAPRIASGNVAARPARPRPTPARMPLHAVHQFHPGSARGDAVTNAMLLIQRILRGLGYASDIYCEQPDPELLDADGNPALRPAAELPLHADYVLLAHFSLGFDGLDDLLRLPAAKVLMYHNITPPALLEGAPVLQNYARLGHAQLSRWRPHVAAALAVSEYNALDLRARGFPVVMACPLLFDIDAMRAGSGTGEVPVRDDVFTVLFVGRLVASKAQDDLVEAFAVFRERLGRPARLVLVGRSQATADSYVDRLRSRVVALDLAAHVVFTGFVSDSQLRQLYLMSDLYVSLSHHEGFGVPLVEAMVHGLAVLAWPCGAVPYTIGAGDPQDTDAQEQLLADRSAAAVAARMLDLAQDTDRRHAIVRRQNRRLDRFRLARHVPTLVQALTLAGAAPPEDAAVRAMLAANMRFTVAGHMNGSYSLAAVNRGLARSIEAVLPGRARIAAVEGTPTTDLAGVPEAEVAALRTLAARPAPATGPHVVISQHYPVHVPQDGGDATLALFFWEESVIPLPTVRVLNAAFRGVLAPSGFVAKVLVDSGVSVPVHAIGQSPDLAAFRRIGAERRALAQRGKAVANRRLTFLHVSSCLPRKGVDILLAAYVRAFRRIDPVRLVIKGYPNPHNDVPDQLAAIRAADPDAPEIVLINRDLDQEAFLDMYRTADAMVLPTRGEGFNLPAAEAMAARVPLIVTGFGGQSDFCDATTARLLSSRFAASASHLATGNSLWVEPSVDDLVLAMHEMFDARGAAPGDAQANAANLNAERLAARVRAAAARIDTTMTDAALVEHLLHAATASVMARPPAPLRMAWITTWNVRCGVAEYARHLLESWPDHAAATLGTRDLVVLADDRTAPEGVDADAAAEDAVDPSGARVRIAWRLGSDDNATNLAQIVAQEDPDILVIQHQPGLLSWPALARLLESPAVARRCVTVTLHNTRHLGEIDPAERARTVAALQAADRVIVHTVSDLEQLKAFGVAANVVAMPHGVPEVDAQASHATPIRTLSPGSSLNALSPVIGCYGFFLPGKGIAQLIAATSILRQTWPTLRLRLVNASYDTPESEDEIRSCEKAVRDAGLEGAVDWHTAFLPEAQSRALLAGCDVVVLPYQASIEASSAALRSVLASDVPVAVTPLAVFDNAAGAVVRLDGIDPVAIAEGVRRLLRDTALRTEVQARARAWRSAHAWPDVAERMAGMLHGLVRARTDGSRPG